MPPRPRTRLLIALVGAAATVIAFGARASEVAPDAVRDSAASAPSGAASGLAPARPYSGRASARVHSDQPPAEDVETAPEADASKPFDPECGGTLHATVFGADGGLQSSARVAVFRDDGVEIGESDENKVGSALGWPPTPTVFGLPIDEPLVAVATSSDATASVPRPFRIARGARAATLELTLGPSASIVVHAKDEAGHAIDEPLHGSATSATGQRDWRGSNVAAGDWRTGELPAGRWTLRFWTASRRAPATVVDVGPGETAEVDVRLDAGASIEGVVVDVDGRPVPGARVRVHPMKWYFGADALAGRGAITGDRGEFTMTGFESGEVRLTAEIAGDDAHPWICTPELVPVTAPAKGVRLVVSGTTSFRVVLERPDGTPYDGPVDLSIGVVDQTYVRYLLDAPTTCSGPGPRASRGVLEGCDLPGDRDTPIVVRVPGYLATGFIVPPRPGGTVDLGEIRLDAGATLTGIVRDPEGRPIAHASVRCDGLPDTATDESGRFVVEHLPPSAAQLCVEADGFAKVWAHVEDAADAESLDIRLTRGALVRVTVRERRRLARLGRIMFAPIEGVAPGASEHVQNALFEREQLGPVEKRLPAGRWRVALEQLPEGISTDVGEWSLAEGQTRDETIVVPDTAR